MSDFKVKCTKFKFGWGFAPDPAGGAYSTPQTPWLHLRGLVQEKGGKGKKGMEGRGRKGGKGVAGSPALLIRPDVGVLE